MSYRVEIIDKKDPIIQLEATKSDYSRSFVKKIPVQWTN